MYQDVDELWISHLSVNGCTSACGCMLYNIFGSRNNIRRDDLRISLKIKAIIICCFSLAIIAFDE